MKKILAGLLFAASVGVVSAQTPGTTQTETKQKTTHTEHKKTTTSSKDNAPAANVKVSKKTHQSKNVSNKGVTVKKTKTTSTTTAP